MKKLLFADQLRGLAALSVAGSHLVGAYWAMRDFVALATAAPVQGGDPPAWLFGVFAHTWLNFGPLGVGVFFLISGLVIPVSLDRHTRGSFLLARMLRIYPTYIAALLLEMALLHAAAAYWHKPFPYGNWTILSNALLIHNTVGQPSIDLVNWTLCVELLFYGLMAMFAGVVRRGAVMPLLLLAGAILAGNALVTWALATWPPLAAHIARHDLVETFSTESVFLVYMLIGVLFNYRLRGRLGLGGFVASVAAMLALFLACWRCSSIAAQYPVVTVNYLTALVLFAVLFGLRRFARPVRALDAMARISFPFYLIHSAVGYSVMKLLMLGLGLGYLPALGLALASALGLATALHLAIETRTIAWGRRLAHRPPDPARPSPPVAGAPVVGAVIVADPPLSGA
jgi:peptidoglycan/LPS O-acetylase OafA/YrhL